MNRRDKMYAALAASQEKINRRLSELEQTSASPLCSHTLSTLCPRCRIDALQM